MQITIFGASGRVGTILTKLALQKGFTVVTFSRSETAFQESNNLIIHKGDIYDASSVAKALNGSELVLSTLGSWGSPKKDIVSTGVRNIIPAMKQNNIKRIITLTGSDAETAGDNPGIIHTVSRPFLKLAAPKILEDGEEHLRLLSASQLDWTTVRSPVMNNSGKKAAYHLSNNSPKPWQTINRTAVAHAMLDLVESSEWSQKAPFITRS